jgi:predicted flavoprotein YhiN
LQISSYWKSGKTISIDTVTGAPIPRRFAQIFAELYAPTGPRPQWTRKEIDNFHERERNWMLTPSGTEGYSKAEVTLGGVDTAELSSQTMESRRIRGLYFIGEVVDVTGQLGGFNFQWAWASGFAAGQAV